MDFFQVFFWLLVVRNPPKTVGPKEKGENASALAWLSKDWEHVLGSMPGTEVSPVRHWCSSRYRACEPRLPMVGRSSGPGQKTSSTRVFASELIIFRDASGKNVHVLFAKFSARLIILPKVARTNRNSCKRTQIQTILFVRCCSLRTSVKLAGQLEVFALFILIDW